MTLKHKKWNKIFILLTGTAIFFNTSLLSPYPYNYEIQQSIDACALELRLARILHEFSVLSGEDDDTVAPLRVP